MTPRVGVAPLRREQIVRATIHCLAHAGYAGLTMKGVAREAGLSQGILHYYFKDKRAILAAAALRVSADLDRRVAAEARGARGARARLRALVRACLDGGRARPRVLDGVHRAVGREPARSDAGHGERARLRALPPAHRGGDPEGRAGRAVPSPRRPRAPRRWCWPCSTGSRSSTRSTGGRSRAPEAERLCEDVLWAYLRRRGGGDDGARWSRSGCGSICATRATGCRCPRSGPGWPRAFDAMEALLAPVSAARAAGPAVARGVVHSRGGGPSPAHPRAERGRARAISLPGAAPPARPSRRGFSPPIRSPGPGTPSGARSWRRSTPTCCACSTARVTRPPTRARRWSRWSTSASPTGGETPLHWEEEIAWKAYAVFAFRLHTLDHIGQVKKLLAAGRG